MYEGSKLQSKYLVGVCPNIPSQLGPRNQPLFLDNENLSRDLTCPTNINNINRESVKNK